MLTYNEKATSGFGWASQSERTKWVETVTPTNPARLELGALFNF